MRPRWGQVREFCRIQGYRETRTDHYRFLKVLPDRSTSGTMVSMGVDAEEMPSQMWRLVWRHQLKLAGEDEFWKGLRGEPVRYATTPTPKESEPLPAYLSRFLRDVLHRSEDEIGGMTREEAQELLDAYHAQELREP
jgi:hypothetical protein